MVYGVLGAIQVENYEENDGNKSIIPCDFRMTQKNRNYFFEFLIKFY